MTRFKEMCLDVSADDQVTGRFWAELTGCRFEPDAGAPGDVVGDQEGMGIALCEVPEHKSVKNRVHLDVDVASLEEVTALGGALVERHEHWTVCADPVGNEFCAFVRDGDLPAYRTREIAVDAGDAESIARWWADVFGVEVQNEGQPWWWLQGMDEMPTAGPDPHDESVGAFSVGMAFGPVPEPKTVKNRMHWDIYGDVEDLHARGATRLWETPRWTVLADPEGNEFCVFPEEAA